MTGTRDWELQLGKVTVMPRIGWGNLFGAADLNQAKLREAIPLAQKMALAALIGLRRTEIHLKTVPRSRLASPAAHPADVKDVMVTLAKYFSLSPGNLQYRRYLGGMISVFEQIKLGLLAPFDLVVFHPDSVEKPGIQGYVTAKGTVVNQPASPIRKTFGFVDEDNHLPWKGHSRTGRMHLSIDCINSKHAEHGAAELARNIVHEASHRFARTTDVLYVFESWAEQFHEGRLDQETFEEVQPTMKLPQVTGKTITPLAGFDKSGNDISDVRWLENADSYAYSAKRLLKKYRA